MGEEKIITGCPHDCGGACVLVAHVEGGALRRITTDPTPDTEDKPQLRACVRGRAQRQRVYHPDRLQHPLRRVGERGRGEFARISWEEALDTVAREMLRVRAAYGPGAILNLSGTGNTKGKLHQTVIMAQRLLNKFGGQTFTNTNVSFQGAIYAVRRAFGFTVGEEDRETLAHSELIILWGDNPAVSHSGTNLTHHYATLKERGARFICIDPYYTDTAATLADQWLPIRPGTDTALMLALAHTLIAEGLTDQPFLGRYTVGYEAFRDYVMGREDGVPKTPAWQEPITGVPAAAAVALAREYARARPAALKTGWGPGRTAHGEQFHRAAIALSALTGNIGSPGGATGAWAPSVGGMEAPDPHRVRAISPGQNPVRNWIPYWAWAEAVLQGAAGGYPSDIKLIYSVGGNHLNQYGDINRGVEALRKVEFIAVQEQFLTPMARFADIVLPAITHFEHQDLQTIHQKGEYFLFSHQVLPPQGEAKSDLEICSLLAKRLGIEDFSDHTEEGWLRSFVAGTPVADYDAFKAQGLRHRPTREPKVPLSEFIADPAAHPLPTPSGKIELYSERIAKAGRPDTEPALPKYIPPWAEGQIKAYPLVLTTVQSRRRASSTFGNVPWLAELEEHRLAMNPQDARARGLKDGERVKVFNAHGATLIPVRLTERLMPGVVSLEQGANYDPGPDGVDRAGSANVLTPGFASPGGAAVTSAIPVQVERA